VHPFDSPIPIEFLSNKNDCSLFAFGSHTKKRPNNLILGRLFDHHVLDMLELGVENFKSCFSFATEKVSAGNRPCFIFVGLEFQQKEEYKKLSNLLLDFYQGTRAKMANLIGLEYVIVCTVVAEKICFRTYRILLKKSGTRIPRVELEEMGPSFDLVIRRSQFASTDLNKMAFSVSKILKPKKEKNIALTDFATAGTLHIGKQDLSKMATKKMKGLNKKRKSDESTTPNSETDNQQKKVKVQE